jgi:hypothetical protein
MHLTYRPRQNVTQGGESKWCLLDRPGIQFRSDFGNIEAIGYRSYWIGARSRATRTTSLNQNEASLKSVACT